VITTAPKTKPKPLAQTQFMLDAMDLEAKWEDAQLEQIKKAMELLII
jgi:hypothetical protein